MRDGKSDLTVGLAIHPSIYPSTYLRFIEFFSARVYLPAYPPLCVLVFTFLSVHVSSTCTLLVSLCFRYLPTCLPISRSLSLSLSLCVHLCFDLICLSIVIGAYVLHVQLSVSI